MEMLGQGWVLMHCIHTMNRGVCLVNINIFDSKYHQALNM